MVLYQVCSTTLHSPHAVYTELLGLHEIIRTMQAADLGSSDCRHVSIHVELRLKYYGMYC